MIEVKKEMKMREVKLYTHYCDVCGKDMKDNYDDVEIEAKFGRNYPEFDCRKGYALDVCEECFLTKVKPCIEENLGIKFHEYDCEDTRYK